MLRAALEETGRIAEARFTIRTKERHATLRTNDGTLVLETMYWPDEIRSTGALDLPEGKEAEVTGKQLEMARALVENLSGKFDPKAYHDEYRQALEQLIERKMKGEERAARRRKPEPSVVDLMDALRQSVEASRARKAKPAPAKRKKRSRKAA
jgi:DNA end-binding protein Ku